MDLPLRPGGVYLLREREYTAMTLGTENDPWEAQALMARPFQALFGDINYVRKDGSIINVNFQPWAHASELVDTGETADA